MPVGVDERRRSRIGSRGTYRSYGGHRPHPGGHYCIPEDAIHKFWGAGDAPARGGRRRQPGAERPSVTAASGRASETRSRRARRPRLGVGLGRPSTTSRGRRSDARLVSSVVASSARLGVLIVVRCGSLGRVDRDTCSRGIAQAPSRGRRADPGLVDPRVFCASHRAMPPNRWAACALPLVLAPERIATRVRATLLLGAMARPAACPGRSRCSHRPSGERPSRGHHPCRLAGYADSAVGCSNLPCSAGLRVTSPLEQSLEDTCHQRGRWCCPACFATLPCFEHGEYCCETCFASP
jgi:hypothetical protein